MGLQGGFRGFRRRRRSAAAVACVLAGLCLASRCLELGLVFAATPLSAPTTSSSPAGSAAPGGALAAAAPAEPSGSASGATSPALAGAIAATALLSLGLGAQRGVAALKGSSQPRRRTACAARGGAEAPLVVIAGPPAAGKGTQCDKIKAKYGYVHISTGDILRENVKGGTELGVKAKEYMDKGALVPSELIVDLVKDRLAQDDVKEKGCLLDGFPRAPDQAQAMVDAGLKVDKFLVITVPDDMLVERGCGRRLDPETGEIYHLKFKPPPEDIVDRLVHRSDDQEDKIRERLKAYHSQIDGIVPYFEKVLTKVDGTGKPDAVFELVTEGLSGV